MRGEGAMIELPLLAKTRDVNVKGGSGVPILYCAELELCRVWPYTCDE